MEKPDEEDDYYQNNHDRLKPKRYEKILIMTSPPENLQDTGEIFIPMNLCFVEISVIKQLARIECSQCNDTAASTCSYV